MHSSAIVWLVALVQLGHTAVVATASDNLEATPVLNVGRSAAITPRQIGVTPVESDLGDAASHIGNVHATDSRYIYIHGEGYSTKWIGVNTEYLTVEGTRTIRVAIATATAAANGQGIGDISVLLPEGLAVGLRNSVEVALSACGAARKARRQAGAVLACALSYAEQDAKAGGLIDLYIKGQELAEAGLVLAEDASILLINYFATLTAAQVANTIVWLAVFSAFRIILENVRASGGNQAVGPIAKINVPKKGFAAKPVSKGCTGLEPVTMESLLCREHICQGQNTGFCSAEPYAKCPCIQTIPRGPGAQFHDIAYLNFQQQWLTDIGNGVGDVPLGGGVDLRVLPIGDSITWGAQSSDENGYRNVLHNMLTGRGNKVDFVGSIVSGSMQDRQHEGHRGKVISEINTMSNLGISESPNLVLLHAGTNDIYRNAIAANALTSLRALIDKILRNNPIAAIFVCQIVPMRANSAITAQLNAFNAGIPRIVSDYVAAGRKMTLVDMATSLTDSDLADALHPNDSGYQKMAYAYYDAITSADSAGWITAAGDPTPVGGAVLCERQLAWSPPRMIATGPSIAYDDGPFVQSWGPMGTFGHAATALFPDECKGMYFKFLDFDGDGAVDVACVDPESFYMSFWKIISGGWDPLGTYGERTGIAGNQVRFADLNGDGRDDLIHVSPDGLMQFWLHKEGSDRYSWHLSENTVSGIGATKDNLLLADLDGDGRADILLVDQRSGEARAWLSRGATDALSFTSVGVIATGATKSLSPDDRVIMGDFTGEGRADYMQVGANGKVNGFINRRSDSNGQVPDWQMYTVAMGPAGALRQNVHFYDITGSGRVDYLLVNETDGNIQFWQNRGTGGKYQKGDGVFICDLNGDGVGDIFWISPGGKGWGFLNKGQGANDWIPLGQTANPADPLRKRENIRMGVLTSSRRADYITVHEDTGRAEWWENLGEAGNYAWQTRGMFATGPRDTIARMWPSWRFSGENVRFADLNGDGFDDYLYVNDQGKVAMWTHQKTNPPSWSVPVLVADKRDPVDPRDVHFADVNGDGRVDYIVVDRVTGAAWVWHNREMNSDGSILWGEQTKIAEGPSGGHSAIIKFADMTGDGRAEYMSISPSSAKIDMWENMCV